MTVVVLCAVWIAARSSGVRNAVLVLRSLWIVVLFSVLHNDGLYQLLVMEQCTYNKRSSLRAVADGAAIQSFLTRKPRCFSGSPRDLLVARDDAGVAR